VITDPVVQGVKYCGFYVDSTTKITLPVVPTAEGNVCVMNIDGLDTGLHTIVVTAISVDDPVWGSQESSPSSGLSLEPTATTATRLLIAGRAAVRAASRFARANVHWAPLAALLIALAVALVLGGLVWFRRRVRSR
jgi:hypothetical protein